MTLDNSVVVLSVVYTLSFMISVKFKIFTLSVVMLSVIAPSVVVPA